VLLVPHGHTLDDAVTGAQRAGLHLDVHVLPEGPATDVYNPDGPAAVLVRPDGYIAARWPLGDVAASVANGLRTLSGDEHADAAQRTI
jgi:hypothetical protein